MVSPTVGAGIDFNILHFHTAFGYATHASCCARSFNQMRGRVRETIDKECHLFIQDNAAHEKLDDDGVPIKPVKPLAITVDDAIDELLRYQGAYLNTVDTVMEYAPDGSQYMIMQNSTIPRSLLIMLAHSDVETNLSATCFRAQLIKLLQKGDPDLEYQFLTEMDYKKNLELGVNLIGQEMEFNEALRANVSVQRELAAADFLDLGRADIRGEEGLLRHEPSLHATLKKNEVKHFYGVQDGVSPGAYEHLLGMGGSVSQMEQVSNFAYILCVDVFSQFLSAKDKGELQSASFILLGDNGQETPLNIPQRRAQEVWASRHMFRIWTQKLMYAAGFDMAGAKEINTPHTAGQLVPGNKGMAAHKGLGEMRLGQQETQDWLNKNCDNIMKKVGIKPNMANMPSTGEEWEWKHVCAFVKQFISNMYGLDCVKGETKVSPNGKRRRVARGYCCNQVHTDEDGNKFPCKGSLVMKPKSGSLQGMLSLVHSHLHNPANNEPSEASVREIAKRTVNKIITDNGFKQILQDFVEAPVPEPVPDVVPEEAVVPEVQYEDGGCGAFEDSFGGYDNTDQYQDNPYQPERIDEIDFLGNHNGNHDGNHDGDNDDDSNGDSNSDTGIGMDMDTDTHTDTDQEEMEGGGGNTNEDNVTPLERLRAYKSIAEQNLEKRMLLAQQQLWGGNDEKKEKQNFIRRTIVNKYVGPNPYTLDAIDFVLLLLGSEYQGAIDRFLD